MKFFTSLREAKRRSNPENRLLFSHMFARNDRENKLKTHIPAKAGISQKEIPNQVWNVDDGLYHRYKHQHGSVFFYILIAVALLAALSYAVSRNNRGSTSIMTEQQTKLAAQEIIDYGNTVAQAVQKLKLRGCSDTEISFENDVISGYTNPNAPSDKSCHIFDIAGGNISFSLQNDNIFDLNNNYHLSASDKMVVNAENILEDIGDTNQTELIYFTPAIKEKICAQINNTLGLGNINFASTDFSVGTEKYTGVFYSGSPIGRNICPSTVLSSKIQGCCHETTGCASGNCYHYYQVLIAR